MQKYVTSRERVWRAVLREPNDVIPVGPFAGFYAARISKVSLQQYVTDGQTIVAAQHWLWFQLDHDIVTTAADTYYMAEAMGLKVDFHDDALPTSRGPVLVRPADAAKLRPADPHHGGRMPVYLEAARGLRRRFLDRIAVRGTGTGPLSLASYLLGPEKLLTTLAEIERGEASTEDERGLATLMEIASETATRFLNAQIEAGVHLAYLGDSLASCDMISPAMYRRFVQPYHKQVFEGVRDHCRRYGAHTLLHVCGDNTAVLDDFAATGADMYEVDSKIDLRTARRTIGDRVCLIGNLDPAGALLHGSEAEAREDAERCLAEAGSGGGFILGTGCFVAWGTPLENLKTMVRAVRNKRTSFDVPPSDTFRIRTGGIGPGSGPVHPHSVRREKP